MRDAHPEFAAAVGAAALAAAAALLRARRELALFDADLLATGLRAARARRVPPSSSPSADPSNAPPAL